jgi:hypothetical protein
MKTTQILAACVIAALTLLQPSASVTAQGGPESIPYCVCKADERCADSGVDCPVNPLDDLACVARTFTPPSSGTYRLRASLSCPDGLQCGHCTACVYVYDHDQRRGYTHTVCQDNICVYDQDQVLLAGGTQYTLYVCLVTACVGDDDCTKCEGCVARGYVYTSNFDSDCWGIVCNP